MVQEVVPQWLVTRMAGGGKSAPCERKEFYYVSSTFYT